MSPRKVREAVNLTTSEEIKPFSDKAFLSPNDPDNMDYIAVSLIPTPGGNTIELTISLHDSYNTTTITELVAKNGKKVTEQVADVYQKLACVRDKVSLLIDKFTVWLDRKEE